jgi:two-component system, response regulator PdtaR
MKALRVLVVEDDPMIGPLLVETLSELGHIVVALAVDAEDAVAKARECRPELMIVDIELGARSGLAAVQDILCDGFVPHVFVTGGRVSARDLGPDAVLMRKPYRSADIVAAIARALAHTAAAPV